MKKCVFAIILMILMGLNVQPAHAISTVIDFDELPAGTIVDDEYTALGLTISARNFDPNKTHDEAITFDSNNPTGGDSDLGFDWAGGNLQGQRLGQILIIAEDIVDTTPGDGLVDDPDDEGRRPAGWIKFAFDIPVKEFGFDFIDIDNNGTGREDPSEYKLKFYFEGGLVDVVDFSEFTTLGSQYYDASIAHGNNFANRYDPITSENLGSLFDTVKVKFGGSGAIDRIQYSTVPEPASMLLFSTGLVGAAYFRRRNA